MLRADEGALVCDLAETYGVTNYRSMPAALLGTLAAGLGDESRSKMNLSGQKMTRMEMLMAAAVDGLNRITWLLSSVCPHEGEPPRSILEGILAGAEEEEGVTAEDYEAEWARITGVKHNGR